jgi:hypothetical protein
MHKILLYAAYGWLLLGGILHFGIDVVSQYLRGKRVPGPEATLYYGLNTSYALGQVLLALVALLLTYDGVAFFGDWPGLALSFAAAAAWLAIGFFFLEYREPRIVMAIFAGLLAAAAAAR